MVHFTSNTYTLKRKILTFTNKISKRLSKPEHKFTALVKVIAVNGSIFADSSIGIRIIQRLFPIYAVRKL